MLTRRAFLTTLPLAIRLAGKPTSATQTQLLHQAAARALACQVLFQSARSKVKILKDFFEYPFDVPETFK